MTHKNIRFICGLRLGSWRNWGWLILLALFASGCGGSSTRGESSAVVVEGQPTAPQMEEAPDQPTPQPTVTLTAEMPAVEIEEETPAEEESVVETESGQGTAPQNAAAGDTWTRPSDGTTMVYVPAGSFLMGNEEGFDHEKPVHEVALDAFWIDRTEVTNSQFAAFIAATGHKTTAELQGSSFTLVDEEWQDQEGATWRTSVDPDREINELTNHPVLHVSWHDAEAYCAWAGGGLPSEAQWEYAARGPEGSLFPWGDEHDFKSSNFCDAKCPRSLLAHDESYDDGYAYTAPVGSYPNRASWVGGLDMAGNALEWVFDAYDNNFYEYSPASNPRGPQQGDLKVLRGGSWSTMGPDQRTTARINYFADYSSGFIGFRCASPVEP